MEQHKTGTEPTAAAELICRNRRWTLALVLAALWAAPAIWWCLDAPLWIFLPCLAIALLPTPFLIAAWFRRGRTDHWTLIVSFDGIWVNLRDVEYHRAEPGDTVLFIPFREIVSAKRFVHRYQAPGDDGGTVQHRDRYLELELGPDVARRVAAALGEEQQRDPQPVNVFGIRIRTRRTESPVLVKGDALRIKFHTRSYSLSPRLSRVLEALRGRVAVQPDSSAESPDWDDLQGPELQAYLDELLESGNRMAAYRILKQRQKLAT